jgi:hypothetical protein
MTSASTDRRDRVFPRNEPKKEENQGPQGSAEKLVKLINFRRKRIRGIRGGIACDNAKGSRRGNDYFRVLIVLRAAVILY